jgi:hypothetical protein
MIAVVMTAQASLLQNRPDISLKIDGLAAA